MGSLTLPERVAAARALLETGAHEYEGLSAEDLAYIQEAIEFLSRVEGSFQTGGRSHE